MKIITVSGPPSSGKTSVLLHAIQHLKEKQINPCVMKFDCLLTDDDDEYKKIGVTCKIGLSGSLCPDHYFVSNITECVNWASNNHYDLLISESAGLCNRCSPHIDEVCAICVMDNLSGINTPKKVGPMLKMADIVVITKGDVVSQAEREIFAFKILQANPNASILHVNGITGQGSHEFARLLENVPDIPSIAEKKLRVSMPSALCTYCLGELRIGNNNELSTSQKMLLD